MRTTVDIEPALLKRLRVESAATGRSPRFAMGTQTEGPDLDKALQDAAHLEDDEIARKLAMRK